MENNMTQGNPTSLILRFTIPMIIGNIFQQFYNMVDSLVVGRYVGVDSLAAVGSTGAIVFFIVSIIIGLTVGSSIVVSQYYGAKRYDEMRCTMAMAISCSVVICIVIGGAGSVLARPILRVMNTPEHIFEEAYIYLIITFLGSAAMIAYNLFSSFLRSVGDSKTPLIFLIVSSLVNVVLDLVFVLSFNMGVSGVAYATIIAQGLSAILCFVYMNKKYEFMRLKLKDFIPDKKILGQIITMGIPMALQNSLSALSMMVVQGAVNMHGSVTMAAYTAASKVDQIAMQPLMSLGMAMSTYTGQNVGAGRLDRVKVGLRKIVKISLVCSVFLTMFMFVCGRYMVQIFMHDKYDEIIKIGAEYLCIVSIFYIFLGIMQILANMMRGAGDVWVPFISSIVELFARISAAFILSKIIGRTGIWMAGPIAWILACGILFYRYKSGKWIKSEMVT